MELTTYPTSVPGRASARPFFLLRTQKASPQGEPLRIASSNFQKKLLAMTGVLKNVVIAKGACALWRSELVPPLQGAVSRRLTGGFEQSFALFRIHPPDERGKITDCHVASPYS